MTTARSTPFAGKTGLLLERMLAAIGLERSAIMIGNVVPWRPPGNRPPTQAEMDICRPFIERQIALAEPKHLLLLATSPHVSSLAAPAPSIAARTVA